MKKTFILLLVISILLTGCSNETNNNIDLNINTQQNDKIDEYLKISNSINNTNNNQKTYIESSDATMLSIDNFLFESTSNNKIKRITNSTNDYEIEINKVMHINKGSDTVAHVYATDGYSYIEIMDTKLKVKIIDINDFEIGNTYRLYDIPKNSIISMKSEDNNETTTYTYNVDPEYMKVILEDYFLKQSKSILYSELDDKSLFDTMRVDLSEVSFETIVSSNNYIEQQKLVISGFITINGNSMNLINFLTTTYSSLNDDFKITKPILGEYSE